MILDYFIGLLEEMFTFEFAHGNIIPMVNIPSKGPPTIPSTLSEACKIPPKCCEIKANPMHSAPYVNTKTKAHF